MSIGISSFLSPSAVVLDLRTTDKTSLLHELSRRAAEIARLPAETIFAELDKRERLGSTGIGDGIAIPHAKYLGLTETIGLATRLKPALDFDAVDGRPVDLVFLLLAPASSDKMHLNALAAVSRRLRNREAIAKLRASPDAASFYSMLTSE
jgi:PTS system nitrogen regulatory IIA component